MVDEQVNESSFDSVSQLGKQPPGAREHKTTRLEAAHKKAPHFQFRYDPLSRCFLGLHVAGQHDLSASFNEMEVSFQNQSASMELYQSGMNDSSKVLRTAAKKRSKAVAQNEDESVNVTALTVDAGRVTQAATYGQGIRIVRLFRDRIADVDEFKQDQADEDEIEEYSREKEGALKSSGKSAQKNGYASQYTEGQIAAEDQALMRNNVLSSQNSLIWFVENSSLLHVKAMANFKVFALVVISVFTVLCIINHFVMNSQLNESDSRYEVINASYK